MIATLEGYHSHLEGILARFMRDRDGIHINRQDDSRFREIVLELRDIFHDDFVDPERHSGPLIAYFNDGISNFSGTPSYHSVESIKGVLKSAILRVNRNPQCLKAAQIAARNQGKKDIEIVATLSERLHGVVRQLRERREARPTLDVNDEYDVQDLFHALLTIHFDDIRKEEWSLSYAGGASRLDFYLPEAEAVVEIKMTRPSLSTKQLGEQLIVDIAKYKKHPGCRTLYCVVYDPTARISNPRGVENDLREDTEEMTARVMIVPK